jgi:hypothetical protein
MSHPETQEHFRRTDFIPDRSRAKSPGSVEVLGAVRVSGGVDGRYIGRTALACQRACESFLTEIDFRGQNALPHRFFGACLTADTVRNEAEPREAPLSRNPFSRRVGALPKLIYWPVRLSSLVLDGLLVSLTATHPH